MPGIAPATRMGAVHLTVSDLERSLAYYERAVGLQLHGRDNGTARLGAGAEDLLVLYEQAGAAPAPRNTGLFHFALLLPSRHDLARWLARAANTQIPLEGMSDHLVSEAIYLRDPDWHGIEIYRDRPRAEWEREGEFVRMATNPLDIPAVMSALEDDEPDFERMPPGTTMGHVHLQVADIPSAEQFYTEVLGFDVQARYGTQATFVSAGGYHHHLGANTWNSRGAAPAPEGSAALRHATVLIPDDSELERIAARVADAAASADGGIYVRDPSQNKLLLQIDGK
jgi:catechol 2,3-dioxygenase